MTVYTFRALDPDGRRHQGEVAAEDEAEALELVARRGLTPVALAEGHAATPWWSRDIRLTGHQASFKPVELEQFFSTFASMLLAHLPLARALRSCIALMRAGPLRRHLERSLAEVENGASLATALQDPQGRFPERLIRIVALGEASNSLARSVASIDVALRAEGQVRSQLKQALIYPAILLAMSALVLSVLVFFLAPSLVPIFEATGATVPVVISMMMGTRSLLLDAWPLLLGAMAAIAALGLWLGRPLRAFWQGVLLRLPVSGRYLQEGETLRFCQSLHLMLASGARLVAAVEAAAEAVHLQAWRAFVKEAATEIRSGGRLADAIQRADVMDPKTAAVLIAAEESDMLVETLPAITADLQSRTARTLAQAVQLLTPLITLVIGTLIGFVILSTITAIMDLNDAVL
jgi:general secretion pathway protein F